jgi:hypothetical protein
MSEHGGSHPSSGTKSAIPEVEAASRVLRPREFRRALALSSLYQIMCYTETVQKQNLTLVVDGDLLIAAKKVALDRRTSVNQLVREYLENLVDEHGRRSVARARLKRAFAKGLVEIGEKTWNRDELYER